MRALYEPLGLSTVAFQGVRLLSTLKPQFVVVCLITFRDTDDIAEPLEASGPLQSTNTLKDIENRSTIDHLMSLLSDRQQEIFLLYEGLGYNQTQIGGALGISQQAVAQVLDTCHVIFRQQGYKKEGQPERNFNMYLVK
jgi:DNA-directed RNA polymerase specialized sigma subunit